MAELLRRYAPLLLAIVAIVGGCAAFRVERHRILHDTLQPDRVVTVKSIDECSGLAWWPSHHHLLSVGDNGIIAELTLDGEVVRSRHYDHLDLEDIVLLDEDTAVVVAEQQHLLAKVRLSDLAILDTHELPLISPVRGMNRLFEGLTLDPLNGRFVLAHEDHPAAIVRLAADGQTVDHTVIVDVASLSAVELSPDGAWALVISNGGELALLDQAGRSVAGRARLPTHHTEGCAIIPGVGMVLCTDDTPSRLLIFSQLDSWDAIRHHLTHGKIR